MKKKKKRRKGTSVAFGERQKNGIGGEPRGCAAKRGKKKDDPPFLFLGEEEKKKKKAGGPESMERKGKKGACGVLSRPDIGKKRKGERASMKVRLPGGKEGGERESTNKHNTRKGGGGKREGDVLMPAPCKGGEKGKKGRSLNIWKREKKSRPGERKRTTEKAKEEGKEKKKRDCSSMPILKEEREKRGGEQVRKKRPKREEGA